MTTGTTRAPADPIEAKLFASIAKMEEICITSKPTDPYYVPAWDMSGAHGMMFRHLLSIYQNVETLQLTDHNDFIHYCLAFVAGMEHHHHWEEEWYYPKFKGAISIPQIQSEHHTFELLVESLKDYLTACLPLGTKWGPFNVEVKKEKSENFNPYRLKGLVGDLVLSETFVKHLIDELDYLTPEAFRSAGLTHEEVAKIGTESEQYFAAKPPQFNAWAIQHLPRGGWPNMPWVVKRVLFPWVFYWPGRYMWRFSPGPAY